MAIGDFRSAFLASICGVTRNTYSSHKWPGHKSLGPLRDKVGPITMLLLAGLVTISCSGGKNGSGGGNGGGGGSGSQGLASAVPYSFNGFYTGSVALADVNGDGKPDLLIENFCNTYEHCTAGNGQVGVLLGKGDGTFQDAVNHDSGGPQPFSLVVADVNGDGELDLLPFNSNAYLTLLLGNGNGDFQETPNDVYAQFGTNPVAADVNGDGKIDLIFPGCDDTGACFHAGVSVYLGNGDGGFHAAGNYNSGGNLGSAAAIADFNKDGKPDIVMTFRACNCTAGVFLGNGD